MIPTKADLALAEKLVRARKMVAQYAINIKEIDTQLSKLRKHRMFLRREQIAWEKDVVQFQKADPNRLLSALNDLRSKL